MNVNRSDVFRWSAILIVVLALFALDQGSFSSVSASPPAVPDVIPVNQTGGPVSWWSGDGHADDSVGGNHAAFDQVEFVQGKFGQAFSFNGRGSYLEIPDTPSLESPRAMTVTGWFKLNSLSSQWQAIYWKGNTPDCTKNCENRENTLFVRKDGALHFTSTPKSKVGVSQLHMTTPAGVVQAGSWYHFATVVDAEANQMRIYLNGELRGRVPYDESGMRDTGGPWRIGTSPTSNFYFNGLIDEFAIYNRALSSEEIMALYRSEVPSSEEQDPDPTSSIPEIDLVTLQQSECSTGEPCVHMYITNTRVPFVKPVLLNLSIVNSFAKPPMSAQLIIQVPSGWTLSGSGFNDACTGQCSAVYEVAPGGNRSIEITLQPNQAGTFEINSRLDWFFGGDKATIEGKNLSASVTVEPLEPPTPTPSSTATPASTTAPASVLETPVPNTSGSGGGGAGGCNLVPGSVGTLGVTNLVLLVGPLLGMIGWRRLRSADRLP